MFVRSDTIVPHPYRKCIYSPPCLDFNHHLDLVQSTQSKNKDIVMQVCKLFDSAENILGSRNILKYMTSGRQTGLTGLLKYQGKQ